MSFKKYSLFTGELMTEYNYVSKSAIENAVAELDQAFNSWKTLTTKQRQKNLKPVLFRLKERLNHFSHLMTSEMGKPIAQSIAEVEKCIATIEKALQLDLQFLEPVEVNSIYSKSILKTEALGIIYSIMPWNFPLWQVVRMIIPALLAGNVILLKHSEVTPLMGDLIEELFKDIYDFSLLKNLRISHELTEPMMADPRIGGASLTGSTLAGLKLSRAASSNLKKTVLELGGSDPYLIFADADLNLSAHVVAQSRLQNTGQSCISAKRCLVHESILDQMIDLLKVEFSKYTFGELLETSTHLGPLADLRFKKAHLSQVDKLKKMTEAKLVFSKSAEQNQSSSFVDSEIYLLPKNSDFLRDQEFFAPLLCVIPFKNEIEAIQIANSTVYGLGAGVFTNDLRFANQVSERIQAGQVAINEFIKTELNLPFGGTKLSGHGRELGVIGFTEFTQTKVISFS
jgi:succinate-semialdehyde dehydrogenase/glutarate-semialdehyde dehydrogenase